jgi:DNA (cytosine-5)-methyltransferase 1
MIFSDVSIPIIDLFAGPGGLGEGFSSYQTSDSKPFKISLSIEKNPAAHNTLELRSFFRQFPIGFVPENYYLYLQRQISREYLFNSHPDEAHAAMQEAWCAELGSEKYPHEVVDERIKGALGMSRSPHWILIGGPPCQAYSVAGRSRIKYGKVNVSYDEDHRHFLYKEYLRILAVHRPSVFVMENVPGILSSEVKGEKTFPRILNDLKNPDKSIGLDMTTALTYRIYSITKSFDNPEKHKPADFIVKAEEYGIPQARHRVILLGIRNDIDIRPSALERAEPVSMWDVIGDLPKLRSTISRGNDSCEAWESALRGIADAEWLTDINHYIDVKEKLIKVSRDIRCIYNSGDEFIPGKSRPLFNAEWYCDENINGICNHTARSHMKEDLYRYIYAACFASIYELSPQLIDFPPPIWPKHKNVMKSLRGDMFADRFRVQVKTRASTTITSHISKDGHYFIHPDPYQCRSLTVREAARLQTFPDNYFFEGTRTEQYHQVGNAVPPLLAREIAAIVYKLFK